MGRRGEDDRVCLRHAAINTDVHKMEMHEYTADVSRRKTVCHSSLKAMSPAGPYTNEYVWFLTFDESGKKIKTITEFVDTKKVEEVRAALGLDEG